MLQYYAFNDFYHMDANDTLTILPHFHTVQQATDYTCGAAVALMVLNYYGKTNWNEQKIADAMRIRPPAGKEKGLYGTSTRQLVSFFMSIGGEVQSSMGRKDDYSCTDPCGFRNWVDEYLKVGMPIMVEWLDWGGHCQIIIGHDTMGTPGTEDDVLILADPYDTSDHCRDGYYVFGLERFFSMWFDAQYFNENEAIQQWVITKQKEQPYAIFQTNL